MSPAYFVSFNIAGGQETDFLCPFSLTGKMCIERRLSALLSGICA